MFKHSDIQYTTLTPDKILNSLVYRTLFYVNIYGSYKLLKTVRFLAHPVRRYTSRHVRYLIPRWVLVFHDLKSCMLCNVLLTDWPDEVTTAESNSVGFPFAIPNRFESIIPSCTNQATAEDVTVRGDNRSNSLVHFRIGVPPFRMSEHFTHRSPRLVL